MAAAEGTPLTTLDAHLAERLNQDAISASEFMALALYHPEHGYYRRAQDSWGFEGADYFTALDCGPLLGEALALRLHDAWVRLNRPKVFTILEAGAGRGWLGRDILAAAQEPFASALRYFHRDENPSARKAARNALAPWIQHGRVRFIDETEALEPFLGAVLSNEFFDALPAQPWRWDGQRWLREVLTQQGPSWETADPGEAGQWFTTHAENGLQTGDGSVWCESWPIVLGSLCETLQQGLFLTIDYGDTTSHLLSKGAGLRRYRDHRVDARWWEAPGSSDLTADVDFTRLQTLLEKEGLAEIQEVSLGHWIRTHAPMRDLEAQWLSLPPEERAKRRENLLHLTLPHLMGERFRVVEAWKA